jgi:hypothetical protein
MRRAIIQVAIALALVAVAWAAGRAQTRVGDFEIAIDAVEGSTNVECVRGCSLIGSRDVGNPRAGVAAHVASSPISHASPPTQRDRFSDWGLQGWTHL